MIRGLERLLEKYKEGSEPDPAENGLEGTKNDRNDELLERKQAWSGAETS